MTPSQYPPPVKAGEFIASITGNPENRIEVGVLLVGAGPANLSLAIRLSQLLQEDPQGTIAQLSSQVGYDPNTPFGYDVKPNPKAAKLLTKSDDSNVKAMIAEEAKKLFDQWTQENPVFQQTAIEASKAKVNAELNRISQEYNVQLDDADKDALLQVAVKLNEPNLEYVFLKMKTALDQRRAEAERVKSASPKKTVGTQVPQVTDAVKVRPKTIEEAWEQAKLVHANR
jgi:hypothetical protein